MTSTRLKNIGAAAWALFVLVVVPVVVVLARKPERGWWLTGGEVFSFYGFVSVGYWVGWQFKRNTRVLDETAAMFDRFAIESAREKTEWDKHKAEVQALLANSRALHDQTQACEDRMRETAGLPPILSVRTPEPDPEPGKTN